MAFHTTHSFHVTIRRHPSDAAMQNDGRNTRERMNNKVDELTKAMAQSVPRRALKQFGVRLAGLKPVRAADKTASLDRNHHHP